MAFLPVEALIYSARVRFELGPALQQADALLFELRFTLVELIDWIDFGSARM
jgi:hypothetical protein